MRTLVSNGPEGPGRTETLGLVTVGTDPLAIDAFGAGLLHKQPDQIGHLRLAAKAKVGEIRLDRVRVKHVYSTSCIAVSWAMQEVEHWGISVAIWAYC